MPKKPPKFNEMCLICGDSLNEDDKIEFNALQYVHM